MNIMNLLGFGNNIINYKFHKLGYITMEPFDANFISVY